MLDNEHGFDVYLIHLDPTVGSEVREARPCLVISPDEVNHHIRTAIVVPMTGLDNFGGSCERRGTVYEFSDAERAALSRMRAITQDEQGRECLMGLTLEETSIYMALIRKCFAEEFNDEESRTFLKLHKRHESARLEIILTQAYLQDNKPTHH